MRVDRCGSRLVALCGNDHVTQGLDRPPDHQWLAGIGGVFVSRHQTADDGERLVRRQPPGRRGVLAADFNVRLGQRTVGDAHSDVRRKTTVVT